MSGSDKMMPKWLGWTANPVSRMLLKGVIVVMRHQKRALLAGTLAIQTIPASGSASYSELK